MMINNFRKFGVQNIEPQTFLFRRTIRYLAIVTLIWLPGILSAAGLTLYSYQDDLGQTIIVDSPEKIPAQYRKQAREEFIPAFRSPKKKKNDLTIIEAVPDPVGTKTQTDRKGSNNAVPQIIAPPDESDQAQVASASAFMDIFRQIQLDSERIHVVANSFGLESPVLHQLHQINVNRVNSLEELRKLEWDAGKEWQKEAMALIERYKTLQYTISKWLRDNRSGLKHGLPALLQVNSQRLQQLEQTFNRLKDAQKNVK